MNDELTKTLKSYRFTVLCLSGVIITLFVLFGLIVWFQLPELITETVKPVVHEQVRAAFDEAIESAVTK